MKAQITSKFKGIINGIIFTRQDEYEFMVKILKTIEKRFGCCYKDVLIKDLHKKFKNAKKYVELNYDEIEIDTIPNILEAKDFSEIEFEDSNWSGFDKINEKIKIGYYTIGSNIEYVEEDEEEYED
ncbi:hypothetical protein [Fusobacterium necrophorum]|uniref:Uncharacterized protein n=1 Tax=Fusobacterium necrophorum subsp. funduliforme TaxID=143387 RepID=A0A162J6N0_9FUSO|nr:hypothetical protein [Fusobacterium necrophorum]KYL05231.1 hypothetical protein A2J07_00415 [Fusobacterium necrophorum subsp. funduliforme]MDK4524968.1 hypothetical protein [Fusobacterium necrophorum]